MLQQVFGTKHLMPVCNTALIEPGSRPLVVLRLDEPAYPRCWLYGFDITSMMPQDLASVVNSCAQDPTEVLDEYGADALRLYLINSPVVRAETLKFRKEGVFSVIKDVMLPWYNAYRFFVQNALRWEAEAGVRFEPLQARPADLSLRVRLGPVA